MLPIIIAHRGASALAKQDNTLESFKLAISIGADMAEFDIRKTKDDILIAFHDPDIDKRPINSLSYEELNTITQKRGYKVPTLSEVLKLCKGNIRLDIEIKESGYEAAIISEITSTLSYDEYTVKSFNENVLIAVKKLDDRITTGLLVGRFSSLRKRMSDMFPYKRLLKCQASFLSPHFSLCSKSYVRHLHQKGYQVFPWTVNDINKMKKLKDINVDGIITDYPNKALDLLKNN